MNNPIVPSPDSFVKGETYPIPYENGRHFVIARASDKRPSYPPPHGDDWEENPAPFDIVCRAHAHAQWVVGVRPHTFGVLIVDVDLKTKINGREYAHPVPVSERVAMISEALGAPICEYKTRGGGVHMIYREPEGDVPVAGFFVVSGLKAGDIRWRSGYAIIWDPDAMAAGLENIDDYEPVNPGVWPLKKERQGGRSHTENVARALTFISPNLPMDDWARIVYSCKEGDVPVSIPDQWSERGESYVPGEVQRMYDKPAPEDGVSKFHVLDVAEANGAPKFGRPLSNNPSEKTEANKRAAWHTEMENYAMDAQMPERLLLGNRDTFFYDAARILHYLAEDVIRTPGENYLCNENGFWTPLTHREECGGLVHQFIGAARALAAQEIREKNPDYARYLQEARLWDGRHTRNVKETLINRLSEKEPISAFLLQRSEPIIQITQGGAYDVRDSSFLPRENVRKKFLVDNGWRMEKPTECLHADDEKTNRARSLLLSHYGEDLLRRLARSLLGTSKQVDVINAPSDWGKSTLVSMLGAAFPGMVGKADAAQLVSRQGRAFTHAAVELTTKRWYFVDEMDKVEWTTSDFNKLTDDALTVERKYENAQVLPRTGNLILMGGDWPNMNTSAQGVPQRIGYAVEVERREGISLLSKSDHDFLIYEPAAHAFLRAWILNEAQLLWLESNGNADLMDAASIKGENHKDFFLEEQADPIVLALREIVKPKYADWVSKDKIKERLQNDFDIEMKGAAKEVNKTLKTAMRAAFPGERIEDGKKQFMGKREPVYLNFTES